MNELSKLFVTGVGRSGTTLMQLILSRSSELVVLPEVHFANRFVKTDGWGVSFTHQEIESLKTDKFLRRAGLDISSSDLKVKTKQDFFVALAGSLIQEKCQANYICEKDPSLSDKVGILLEADSSSKVIVMERDPRDVIASRVLSKWGQNYTFNEHLIRYRHDRKYLDQFKSEKYKDQVLFISYEDLTNEPKSVMAIVEIFLNLKERIDWEDISLSQKNLIFNDEIKWKQNANKTIIKNNSGNWRNIFSKSKILSIEKLAIETEKLTTCWKFILAIRSSLATISKFFRKIKRKL